MSTQSPTAIGKKYNNTVSRNEGTYALSIAETRLDELNNDGIYPGTLAGLRERVSQLEPLERYQISCQQRYEGLTDRLNRLIFKSIGCISTVYNFANLGLGQTDPAALESLPSRSGSHTVKNQTTGLLKCAAFIREHAEAFAAVHASPALPEELETLAEDMSVSDAAQEKARVEAENASTALFACRGSIYLTSKAIYSAGRNAFRKQPDTQELFAFRYMKSNSNTQAAEKNEAAREARAAQRAARASALAAGRAARAEGLAAGRAARAREIAAKKAARAEAVVARLAQKNEGAVTKTVEEVASAKDLGGAKKEASASEVAKATAGAMPSAEIAQAAKAEASSSNGQQSPAPIAPELAVKKPEIGSERTASAAA